MTVERFYIKRGDRLPLLRATLEDAVGVVDLTGATVKFLMKVQGGVAAKVSAAATVNDPVAGSVSYVWEVADTDTAGTYNGEFEVTFATGHIQTFPNHQHIIVIVTSDVG